MTRRLATIGLVTILLIGGSSRPAWAQHSDAVSLRDLSAFSVLAWDIDDAAKALGLTKEAVQSDVEMKLRHARVSVVTVGESVRLPGTPSLYVKVAATDVASGVIVTVQLRQNVLLERNRVLLILIPTWDRTIFVANPTAQRIRNSIS